MTRRRRLHLGLARGIVAGGALVAGAMTGVALAAEPPPGATSCAGCHGGIAPMPALAGKPPADTEAALAGFRSGAKPATVMNRIAKGFTPEETAAIAQWWGGR